MPEPVAVIDCGSNSTRLLIADGDGRTLERAMRITRLSSGVDATGHLAPDAMARTFAVLAEYRALMDRYDVGAGVVVGTSAIRDATNRDEFVDRARHLTNVEVRVLDGQAEAEFSYEGATADLATDDRATMIVDVGGGSTELAVRLDALPPAEARAQLQRTAQMLEEELLPHENHEQQTVYPILESLLAGENPTGPLIHTHGEIRRLSRLFARRVAQLPSTGPSPEDLRDMHRLLYGLHAILSLHFAQEDELYSLLTA